MIECAVNRTLILLKRNPWQLDSMWFEPEKDFLYFDDYSELPGLIRETTENWHKYEHIVDSAFIKAKQNYTVQNFIDTVQKEIS
jgi:hypothetical protein